MRSSAVVVSFSLVLALACGGESSPGPAPQPVLAPVPADLVPSAAGGGFVFDENNQLARSQVVAAYRASCAAVIPARASEWADGSVGDVGNECLFVEFGQNCNPDLYGCYDVEQKCEGACGAPCDDCQRACAPACDSCKAACNGDAACLDRCAEQRADCRDQCFAARSDCIDACGRASLECDRAGEARMAATCGDCGAFAECRNKAGETQDYEAAHCKALLPAPECEMYCAWH